MAPSGQGDASDVRMEDVPEGRSSLQGGAGAGERSKRPRVSFATVATRTFDRGCNDPQKLSSPQERMLSPLPEALADDGEVAVNEEETTQEMKFPGINDLCNQTPEQLRGRRTSMSGELGEVQRQVQRAFGSSGAPRSSTSAAEASGTRHSAGAAADASAASSGLRGQGAGSLGSSLGSGGGADDSAGGGRSSRDAGADDLRQGAGDAGGGRQQSRRASEGQDVPYPATPVRNQDDDEALQSPDSGEDVTGNVDGLTKLLESDELACGEQQAERRWPSMSRLTPRPSRSPGAPSEAASPPPADWDMYEQWKKNGPGHRNTLSFASVPELPGFVDEAGLESRDGLPHSSTAATGAAASAVGDGSLRSRRSAGSLAGHADIGRCFSFSDRDVPAAPAERRSPAEAAALGGEGLGAGASGSRRSGKVGEDTVEMGAFCARIREGPAGDAIAEAEEESEVPEGRKSFKTRLVSRTAASLSTLPRVQGSPSTSRPSTEIAGSPEAGAGLGSAAKSQERSQTFDFERMNKEFDLRAGKTSAPSTPGFNVDVGGRGTGCSAAGVPYPPGMGLLAGIGAQPHNRGGRVSSSHLPGGERSSHGGASEALDTSAHGSFIGSDSAPLPGVSSLQAGPFDENSNHSGLVTPMAWDDFLGHTGVKFTHASPTTGATPQVPVGPSGQHPIDALAYKRISCWHRAQKEWDEKARAAEQHVHSQVQRWNHGGGNTSAALELLQVLDSESDLKHFKAEAKAYQAECKLEAYLKWYANKHDWLVKDLRICREHLTYLRQGLSSLQGAASAVEKHKRTIEAALRQQQSKCDLLRGKRQARGQQREELRATQEQRPLARRRAGEVKDAARAERRAALELQRDIGEAQQALRTGNRGEDARMKDAYLQKRLRRVMLQQLRGMRSCRVADRGVLTSSNLELTLRGGARARVARPIVAGPGGIARVILEYPPLDAPLDSIAGLRPGAEALRKLSRELSACSWKAIVNSMQQQPGTFHVPNASSLELTVPAGDVPRLVRRLDFAAVKVWTQIQALKNIRKAVPEVVQMDAELREGEIGGEPLLVVTASLLLERGAGRDCHRVKVDASKCCLAFTADLSSFPEAINWSDVTVRQVFGRGEAPAIGRALQGAGSCNGVGGGGLAEVLTAAVEAMRKAG